MMEHRTRLAGEQGFTIIEVMVAAFVMLVGVLGTVKLIDAAIGVGSTSRSREAATNLSREIVEAAREVDYDLLLTSTAQPKFQALSGLADDDAATAGWQIKRRNTTYTVTVGACIYDDPKDGNFAATPAPATARAYTRRPPTPTGTTTASSRSRPPGVPARCSSSPTS